jgi:hypothetical protein
MDQRNRWLLLSAVFLPLASAMGFVFGVIWLLKSIAPEVFAARGATLLELALGMAILFAAMLAGFLLGTILLVLLWRPFVPRSELEGVLTKPYVPVISRLLALIFDWVYPSEE